jgi:hypothetical protein
LDEGDAALIAVQSRSHQQRQLESANPAPQEFRDLIQHALVSIQNGASQRLSEKAMFLLVAIPQSTGPWTHLYPKLLGPLDESLRGSLPTVVPARD